MSSTARSDSDGNMAIHVRTGYFVKEKVGNTCNVEAAAEVGRVVAERAVAAGAKAVVFDRGGLRYHGRVKALADAAREGGLEF